VTGPLGRNPLGGRNWEGFGADPFLSGVAMDATVRGYQDAGVQACAKHYIGNEQETQRSNTDVDGTKVEAISSNIDDRTLHELYLWPFADTVKAGAASIMCSYNRLNMTYACESDESLNKILKTELGFQGYVMSDWFATHSGVNSIEGGLDMTMPGPLDVSTATDLAFSTPYEDVPSFFGGNLTVAVQNGSVAESRVDDMVRRIMTPYYYLSQDQNFPTVDPSNEYLTYLGYGIVIDLSMIPPVRDVRDDHASLIREIAGVSTVLLKNDDSILPISNVSNVAVFGNAAPDTTDGLYFIGNLNSTTRPLGAQYGPLTAGGGSGSGRSIDTVSPLRAIRERGLKDGFNTQYITNNDLLASGTMSSIFPIPDICLVFLKTFASEGWDRISFENDWNSTFVVEQVASSIYCANRTVVITQAAGVNTLPWNEDVNAILASHYGGDQAGNSIVDVLWGDVNPAGHLTYTIPKDESDYDIPIVNITGADALDSDAWQADFTEGLFIDYRHFDAHNITPLYEFGYGLSYTTFSLSSSVDIEQTADDISALPAAVNTTSPGGNPDLWVAILNATVTVANTGAVAGAAVPQLYVSLPTGTSSGAPDGTPVQVLRGFEKISLDVGHSVQVSFSLKRRDLSFWSVSDQEWRIPQGDIQLSIGFSSRDIQATTSVTLVP
jgi:beta-glucosidase